MREESDRSSQRIGLANLKSEKQLKLLLLSGGGQYEVT